MRGGRPAPATLAFVLRASLLLLVGFILLSGCGGGGGGDAPGELTGVIVALHGDGGEITSFTLEAGLEEHEVRIAPDVDYGFDLAHLREHQREALPVRCELEEREGDLYALTIEDA
jgi:hypothetical protein